MQQAAPSSKKPVRRHMVWKDKQGHTIEMEAIIVESKSAGNAKKAHDKRAKHDAHHKHGKPHEKEHAEHHGHGGHAHVAIKKPLKQLKPMRVQVHAIRVDGKRKPVAIAVKRLPHGKVVAPPQIAVHAAAGSADAHQQVVNQLKAIETELKKMRQLLEKMNDDD